MPLEPFRVQSERTVLAFECGTLALPVITIDQLSLPMHNPHLSPRKNASRPCLPTRDHRQHPHQGALVSAPSPPHRWQPAAVSVTRARRGIFTGQRIRSVDNGRTWREPVANVPRSVWQHSFDDGELYELDEVGVVDPNTPDTPVFWGARSLEYRRSVSPISSNACHVLLRRRGRREYKFR